MNQQPSGGGGLRQRPSVVTRRLARARYLVFGAIMAVSALLLRPASQTEFNFSVDAVYVFDDPELKFYRERVQTTFGAGDNMIVVLVSGDPLFAPEPLAALERIHRALAALDGVGEVRSLVNTRVPADDEGAFAMVPLFSDARAPQAAPDVARLRERVAGAATLRGRLISADLSTAVLIVSCREKASSQDTRAPIVDRIASTVARLQEQNAGVVQLRLSGIPIIADSITDLLKRDQLTFIPGVLLVLGVLLFVAFRSARSVWLPFLSTGTAALWMLGVMRLEGHAINVTNNAIIPLLLIIGVGDAVYLLARFEEEVDRQRNARVTVGRLKTAAVLTDRLGIPILLNAVTTAIGFGSLITAKLVIVKEFGVDAAIGVMLAYVVTMGTIPSLLAMLPEPKPRHRDPLARDLSDRLLTRLVGFALRHRALVVSLTLAGVALSAIGALRIHGHDRVLAELPDRHPVNQTLAFASAKLGGLVPFDMVIEAPPGRADDADVVTALEAIQQFAATRPDAPSMISVIDVLHAVDRAVREPAAPALPWTAERVAQYLLLVEMDGASELSPYLSPDRSLARIACFGDDVGTGRVLALRDAVERFAATVLPADAGFHVTGPLTITSSALSYVVRDMVSSLSWAFAVILIVIVLLFRSFKLGLLAVLPNGIAILVALGVMGFSGISLRPGTAMVFSMALGIAVDSAIQWLSRYREERTAHEPEAAVVAAVRGTGRPILYTTVMLSIGLCVFLLSDFVALRNLALLGSTTFVAGMLVDLVLLPVLVIWFKPR
ncbi:MAG: MMPL family transporter [Deltaproteobacteria bacterium]|nr:MMPL family transporter [Deltaproteobacteria bacterium]